MRYIVLVLSFLFLSSFHIKSPVSRRETLSFFDVPDVAVFTALYDIVPESLSGKSFFDIYSSMRLLADGVDRGVLTEPFVTMQLFPKNDTFFSIFTGKELRRIKRPYMRRFPKSPSAHFYTTLFENQKAGWNMRENVIFVYASYSFLFGAYVPQEKVFPPAAINQMIIIPEYDLKGRHGDAFDIFFSTVQNEDEDEMGPELYAMTSGIVVAAKDGWIGGDTYDSYITGGLTPSAGNGVVIYNVAQNRMYSYFHMHSISVAVGDVVYAGDIIGTGGNTGINAKKRGHGKHVHFEIWDIAEGRSLTAKELRDFVVSSVEANPFFVKTTAPFPFDIRLGNNKKLPLMRNPNY